ncbi:MAG: cation:proton antiporter [Actinobacteria bacterium]|nr:cation:proton antiporter [Actinomycetota bacterium]
MANFVQTVLVIPQATSTEFDAYLLAEMGGILLLLGILAFIATKNRLSVVPLFILMGLAFGEGGLIPVGLSEDFLFIGAQIGAILLLLLLGLEYSAREIGESLKLGWRTGVYDILLNAIPGAIVALVLGWGVAGAIVLGGITYVSSSGIAAQLIRESGFRKSETARRVVSILVFEDLALAPYLPIASAVISLSGVLVGAISVSIALVVIGLVLLISIKREHYLSNFLNTQDATGLLLTVFGAALLFAGLAELAGVSGAIAAFLVGLLLSGDVAEAARARLSPLRDFFSALFFLFFGLITNPADIIRVLPIALLLAGLGIAGKFFLARIMAKDMSDPMSWLRIGAFLTPRGEFSIVIAGLALSAPFATDLLPIVLTYVLITALTGSLLLKTFHSRLDA